MADQPGAGTRHAGGGGDRRSLQVFRRSPGRRPDALLALALVAFAPTHLSAQDATAPGLDVDARPPVLVLEDLLGDDWKAARAARREIATLGARAVPRLLQSRAEAPATDAMREPLDGALREIVGVLAEEIGRPLSVPALRAIAGHALGGFLPCFDLDGPDLGVPELTEAELGDAGSISAEEPQDVPGKRARARRARGALSLFGPPVTGFLLAVPPLRDPAHARALAVVANHIYERERGQLLSSEGSEASRLAAFRARYRGVADLAAPLIAAGVRDPEPVVRAAYQEIRDEAVASALAGLIDADPDVRVAAEDALFRLGRLALPSLIKVGAGGEPAYASPQGRDAATRLARRIRFGLSRDLIRRLGHDLEGYDELAYRERRAMVLELERLGGPEAIPALRALLQEEPSDEVRSVAAIGLFRQGDPVGAEWLTLHRAGVSLVRLSKHELAAIYMDQGLRYLTLGRFERAEHEFKQVLEVQPGNEIAWYNLACTYSRWGKLDEAFVHLEKAVECGFDDTSHMAKDPDLDPLRGDERFTALIERIERAKGALGTDVEPPGTGPEGKPEQ